MVSVITGACIGLAAGIISGEGMEVTVNEKGKKRIKKIDLSKGFRKAYDSGVIMPIVMLGTVCGLGALAEASLEQAEIERKEYEELYNSRRWELYERADRATDALIDKRFNDEIETYKAISDTLQNYNGDISKIGVSLTNNEGLRLNGFELYGLARMTEDEISEVLLQEIKEDVRLYMNDIVDTINDSDPWDLENLDYAEQELDVIEKDLF